jgi:Emfourin
VRIRVERSGGLAGIPISNEMDEKDLPSALINTAKKIIEDKKESSFSMKSSPRGAADHFTYKISVQDGMNQRVIECNQYNFQDDLKSLVKYIERNSKRNIN